MILQCILNFCPKCKSFSKIPIIYGYPSKFTFEKARNGEIALGGCIVRDSNSKWQCKRCGYEWGGKRGGKPRGISANKNTVRSINGSFIGNRFQYKRNQKVRQSKWEAIGSWESHQGCDKFEGHIPDWIKKRIPSILGQIWKRKLNKIKSPQKRKEFMLEPFECATYIHDKHYQYKLTLSTGDVHDSITICRKRRFFRGAKNVRRKSKT